MTVLSDLATMLERAAAELAQDRDPFKRAWAAHFREDVKAVKLLAFREWHEHAVGEPVDVEGVRTS